MQENKKRTRWKIVPSAITVGNLFCGFLSILKAAQGDYIDSAWFIFFAGILDSLDGKVARFTGNQSRFGVEFDSFSDIVSFGVAPAVLVYQTHFNKLNTIGLFISFLIIFAGSFRLARFNINVSLSSKKKIFYGLPIPVAAFTIISFILFTDRVWGELNHRDFLIFLIILLSYLMVSSIKYPALPAFSFKKGLKNSIVLILLLTFFLSIPFFKGYIIFPACMIYILSGIIRKLFKFYSSEEEIAELELTE